MPNYNKTQSVAAKDGCSHASINAQNAYSQSNQKIQVSDAKQLSDSPEMHWKNRPVKRFDDGLTKENTWDIP